MRTTAAPAADAPSESPRTEPASAEPAAEPAPTAGDRRPRPAGKRTVIRDEFLVEGKLEKPSAYYVLRRSSLDYDWARLDAKFSPLVLESVQDPLF
jgi:hypothetical protein